MKSCGEGALLTDLYELSMLQAYFQRGMNDTAVFEFFVRALPAQRNFLVAAGLAQVIDYLEQLCFPDHELAWLSGHAGFSPAFVASLRDLRFTGDVDAVPEGTIMFAHEPLLRVTAPLREAQLIESRVINLLHFQTMVASKAARSVVAAPGKRLIDFGMRRAHGSEAALLSARASYIAGFEGSATVAAGRQFGIPLFGTMAHSFIQACGSEAEAFVAYARAFPGNTTLLIDTYDTDAAAQLVVRLACEQGLPIKAVRIDSGDLGQSARRVRTILDRGGCPGIAIIASGNLDEDALDALERHGAPIQGYGVGTRINTSADVPYLDCGYKLVQYAGHPCRKRSVGKATWPGPKQVYRRHDARGAMQRDLVGLADEADEAEKAGSGQALLVPAMRHGKPCTAPEPLLSVRERTRHGIAGLHPALRALAPATPYPVDISPALRALAMQVDAGLVEPAPAWHGRQSTPHEASNGHGNADR